MVYQCGPGRPMVSGLERWGNKKDPPCNARESFLNIYSIKDCQRYLMNSFYAYSMKVFKPRIYTLLELANEPSPCEEAVMRTPMSSKLAFESLVFTSTCKSRTLLNSWV